VTHVEPNAHSAFWLTVYFNHAPEMLFDANARAVAFGGVPCRGICNTKTAEEKIGMGKEQVRRFECDCAGS
jgi:hypothetical protein